MGTFKRVLALEHPVMHGGEKEVVRRGVS